MKNSSKIIGLILIIILTSSRKSNSQPDNFDYGHVENGIYQNDYFDFNIKLPVNWVVQSKEQTENIANTGKKLVAGDDENMKAAIKASEINTANLLAVFQFELGSAVEYNPNIMIVAESVKYAPGIKNGSDYLFQARRMIEQGQFKYDYLSEKFENEKINEIEFYKMDAKLNYMGLNIKQVYYSTVLKGFSLNVIISYISDEQKETLLNSINSMKFKKSKSI
ncbi:MAG: hypothetical protein WCE64_03085 [Bacteroidales bacterium]